MSAGAAANYLRKIKSLMMQRPYMGKPAELGGISPPELFLISTPPFKRDYLEQNIPPIRTF